MSAIYEYKHVTGMGNIQEAAKDGWRVVAAVREQHVSRGTAWHALMERELVEESAKPMTIWVDVPIHPSSTIDSARYRDPVLRVSFKSGDTYEYTGVSRAKVAEFSNSPSPGTWLHSNIKGKHPYRKLDG